MKEYRLIQPLKFKEASDVIYSLINIPILSNEKKTHYFCQDMKNIY